MKQDGILAFHLGWTDVVNCLSLINFHAKNVDRLYVLMRDDAKDFVSFYVRKLQNVICLYESRAFLDSLINASPELLKAYLDALNRRENLNNLQLYFHGSWDRYRLDGFKNKFAYSRPDCHFVQKFYEVYGIPYIEKVNSFNFDRDLNIEESEYRQFVDTYGFDYIFKHDSEEMPISVSGINVANMNKNPFTFIKVLQNSKEIHVIDSFWASALYEIDARYKLFEKKTINIYPFKPSSSGQIRGGGLYILPTLNEMKPIKLTNWKVVI